MFNLLILHIFLVNSFVIQGEKIDFVIDEVTTALDHVLDFMLEHPEEINVDGTFGVVIGEAHLESLLQEDLNESDLRKIRYISFKARKFLNVNKPILYRNEVKYRNFIKNILSPKFWLKNVSFKQNLIDVEYQPPQLIGDWSTPVGFWNILSSSNFSTIDAEFCLMQLIDSIADLDSNENCTVTDACAQQMIGGEEFRDSGYGITHRLLYLQLGKTKKCPINSNFYKLKTRMYCSYIFWEAKQNTNFGFFDELDDLLLEQITLCGYEGFKEFLNWRFIRRILNAQKPNGCFALPLNMYKKRSFNEEREKRTANLIADGCNDHTTGLGVSALSLTLRYLLEK